MKVLLRGHFCSARLQAVDVRAWPIDRQATGSYGGQKGKLFYTVASDLWRLGRGRSCRSLECELCKELVNNRRHDST